MESSKSTAALACAHTMPVCHSASMTELITAACGSAPAACIASSVDTVWHHCPPCAKHRRCSEIVYGCTRGAPCLCTPTRRAKLMPPAPPAGHRMPAVKFVSTRCHRNVSQGTAGVIAPDK